MRENFDKELNKIKTINKSKSYRLLDDLATSYISAYADNKHLDESLLYVKLTRKYLTSKGFTVAEIDDYLLERSYISKVQLNRLKTESIYMNDSPAIARHIENIQDRLEKKKTTDIIIDHLKSKPELLRALKKGINKSNLNRKYNIENPVLLQKFYAEHKGIIG